MIVRRSLLLALVALASYMILTCATYQQAKAIDNEVQRIEQKLDSMIEKPRPVTEEEATAIATIFADLKEIKSVKKQQIIPSHTWIYDVLGYDGKGDILIGVNPQTGEVVKMVKQCPYPGRDGDNALISEEDAIRRAQEFLSQHKLPPIPEGFAMHSPRIITTWKKQHWEIIWRHYVNNVELPSDFVSFIINAENGEISSYSKIVNIAKPPYDRKIDEKEAIERARSLFGKGALVSFDSTMAVVKIELKMIYPNHYFENWKPVWSDELDLTWIIQFGVAKRPVIDVWISATTGELLGGEVYERPIPELWGCMNQTGDIDNYPGWEGAMDLMQYNTNHTFLYPTGCPETDVVSSIQNGTYFIIQSHGDTSGSAELTYTCLSSCDASVDADVLTPDEIPNNDLRYALFSHCMSGWDGPGDNNFRDILIDRGADVFHGYYPYINPDWYERVLLDYLMEGNSLWNSHWNAVAATSPNFTIVIEYGSPLDCYNRLRLAPLLVDVSAPGSVWRNATITATVLNREDARHTTATNVNAELQIPAGFTIISGANPQTKSALIWNGDWTAQWTVHAPLWTIGKRTFDVIVWSDNLGVEVDDHAKPYHKLEIDFGELILVLTEYLELTKWWELATYWYKEYAEPKSIISICREAERFKSVADVKKDPVNFIELMSIMAELEVEFGDHFIETDKKPKEAVRQYKEAASAKIDYLKKLARIDQKRVEEIISNLSAMQMKINALAVNAFGR